MKLRIYRDDYWIKDGIELPSNFDSMKNFEKRHYIHVNNLVHREDGPARINLNKHDGHQSWYLNGLKHRINGPAEIWPSGNNKWYLNGKKVKERIYKRIQKSSKEELLVYMIDSEYKDYLPLIEYGLNRGVYNGS